MAEYTVMPSGTMIELPIGTGYLVLPDGSMIREKEGEDEVAGLLGSTMYRPVYRPRRGR